MKIVNAMPYAECDQCKRCILKVYKDNGVVFVDCKRKFRCSKTDMKGIRKNADGK